MMSGKLTKMRNIWKKRNSLWLIPWLSFVVVVGLGVLHHEMWRDELQAWLIARNSHTLIELFRNIRYEGTPGLWHLGLYVLSRFTANPASMQVFHLIIAAGSIYLVWRYAPFKVYQKVLFIFGYLPAYEYAIISRSYSLGVFFVFLFCVLYPKRSQNLILISVVLFLLAQTSAFGLVFAAGFTFLLAAEYAFDYMKAKKMAISWPQLGVAIVIVSAGALVSILQIKPPADTAILVHTFGNAPWSHIKAAFGDLWRGDMPIPQLTKHFWGTNMIDGSPALASLLGVGIWLVSLLCLYHRPLVFLTYLIITGVLLAYFTTQNVGDIRHWGHFYIAFVACLWLAEPFETLVWEQRFLVLLLIGQLIAFSIAFATDWIYPFSTSQYVANYLRTNHLADSTIVADADYIAAPLSAYLDRPLYYPRSHGNGTFILWNKARDPIPTEPSIIAASEEQANDAHRPVILVTTYPLPDSIVPSDVTYLASFSGAIQQDEQYYIYRVSPQ